MIDTSDCHKPGFGRLARRFGGPIMRRSATPDPSHCTASHVHHVDSHVVLCSGILGVAVFITINLALS